MTEKPLEERLKQKMDELERASPAEPTKGGKKEVRKYGACIFWPIVLTVGLIGYFGFIHEGKMDVKQKRIDQELRAVANQAYDAMVESAEDRKIDYSEDLGHRIYIAKLEQSLEGRNLHSETKKYLRKIVAELDVAADHFERNGDLSYSLVIGMKEMDGGSSTLGAMPAGRHLALEGANEEKLREILGDQNYLHLVQNTDKTFSFVSGDREEARKWTDITDREIASQLRPFSRQWHNDWIYLTDGKPQTGTFWKLALRRHSAKPAKGYKGPSMQPQRNYGARKK
jgi:hypothetical protein